MSTDNMQHACRNRAHHSPFTMLRLLTCCALLLPTLTHAVPLQNDNGVIGKRQKMRDIEVIDHAAEGGTGRVGGCTADRDESSVFCTREDAPGIKEYGLSREDIDLIVATHNRVRAEANATNMLYMSWNDEIAEYAQKWSQTCIKDHDTIEERKIKSWGVYMGQNWAGGSTIEGGMNNWAKEKAIYHYNDSRANAGAKIGHYTQMVQAHSNAFGCGFSYCLNPSNGRYFTNFVCNYVYGQTKRQVQMPYIPAEIEEQKGSMCGKMTDDKLCDYDIVCKNRGRVNVATGQCECKEPYTLGADCAQPDCSVPDKAKCGRGVLIPENCRFVNIPPKCRRMCGAC